MINWRANQISREATVAEIAQRHRKWADIFAKIHGDWRNG